MKVKLKKVRADAIMPKYNYDTDSGIDFYAIMDGVISPHTSKTLKTGIAWEPDIISIKTEVKDKEKSILIDQMDEEEWNAYFPKKERNIFKTMLKLEGRSGLGKQGIDVFGGIVDEDFRGEIKVILYNSTDNVWEYKRGDRIAQGIIHVIPTVDLMEVEEIDDTERGEKGFGSSGR
jgi:dUTPase